MGISEIIDRIYQVAPPAFGEPLDLLTLAKLQKHTSELVAAYRNSGLLETGPFEEARERAIHLHETDIRSILQGGTVLVTGGSGCIGSLLMAQLADLGAGHIVSVDRVRPAVKSPVKPTVDTRFTFHQCDLYDLARLRQIFLAERPLVVFHLGAQRNPGLSERQIRDTLRSNVAGTANVLHATQECGAAHFVFSSTGKTSRYLTSEIYAASKKIAEWQTIQAGLDSTHTSYSVVRFTHVLDNSLVCSQIADRIANDLPINVHAPHRYIIVQSAREAVQLLLNSLVFSQPQSPKISLVHHLGWPGETLQHALFTLAQSGKNLPMYFQGLPSGYEESFFAGQVSWDNALEIHPLVNVLENHTRTTDDSGDTLLVDPAPFSADQLRAHLSHIDHAVTDPNVSDAEMKCAAAAAVHDVSLSSMNAAPAQCVLKILRWGTDPFQLEKCGDNLQKHREIIQLLGESLVDRTTSEMENYAGFDTGEMASILHDVNQKWIPVTPEHFVAMNAC